MTGNMEVSNLIKTSLVAMCVIYILFLFLKWKLNRRRFNQLAAKVPAIERVRMLPIIGHAGFFIRNLEELLAATRLVCAEIKPPRKVWIFHELVFVINRAEDMEVILNSKKCLSKHDGYRFGERFGKVLLLLNGPDWKRHRKIIMPTFNQKILEGYAEIFANQSEVFIEILRSKTHRFIDILDYTTKYSLDNLCEATMGIQIKAQINSIEFDQVIARSMEIVTTRLTILPYHSQFIYQFTNLSKEEDKLYEKFKKFISEVVEKKLFDYRNKCNFNGDKTYSDKIRQTSLLDLLIELSENGENWTSEELFDEVSTFMIAGSDTTSIVLASTMVLLGMHKEIQEKCFDEVREIVGLDRRIVSEDLPKLVYLEQVIKESMRLFPPGSSSFRKIDDDIEVGGYVLPKGAGLALFVLAMHYSEVYYKNPWTFDPEHFSPDEIAKRHKYAYQPFSGGPRNCIGYKFAMMTMKTLLAYTIRNYKIETIYKSIRDIRLRQAVTMKAIEGYPIKLIPRN